MRPLCVIPARRGSKRLPLKNILKLNGLPMIAYTIEAARRSEIFEEVHVSTEDAEIAELALSFGANAVRRRQALAEDLVSATEVCLDVAEQLARSGKHYDAVVCLQPTSPLRNATDVRQSWERFEAADKDFLVSATVIDPHYFHWAIHQTDSDWAMYFRDKYLMERPLLPPVFRPNGAIKIARSEPLRRLRNFFGPRLDVYTMPESRSIHVAQRFDLELAEWIMQRQNDAGACA